MKLPEELDKYPLNIIHPVHIEAIVRDCAKVADEHEFTCTTGDHTDEPVSAAILARYGLKPK